MSTATAQKEDANYLKKVREQYENYPYPPVDPEREYVTIALPVTENFDRLNHFCYGGMRDFRKEFRSLVAGGGTGDAAILLAEQLRDTKNEVIYIDMSEASMQVAQRRAEIRGLTNIRWIRDSLLNIPKLGLGEFDYINCSGVLHHLQDPDAGLKILSDALKPDGAMGIMVYAKYGRMAVYMMQEALRMLNRDEPNLQRQVDNAKKILNNLPLTNWLFNSSPLVLKEMQTGGDIGIYDLLLHSQDRAYTIPELYAFLEKADLNLLQLFPDYLNISSQVYNPAFYISDAHILDVVSKKSDQQQKALAELLHSKIEKHTFFAAKRTPSLPSPEDLDMIPFIGMNISDLHGIVAENIANQGSMVELNQQITGMRVLFPNAPELGAIWSLADGKRTLREIYRTIMDKNKNGANFQTLGAQFKPLYEAMHRAQWLYLRHKNSSPIAYYHELQARIAPKGRA